MHPGFHAYRIHAPRIACQGRNSGEEMVSLTKSGENIGKAQNLLVWATCSGHSLHQGALIIDRQLDISYVSQIYRHWLSETTQKFVRKCVIISTERYLPSSGRMQSMSAPVLPPALAQSRMYWARTYHAAEGGTSLAQYSPLHIENPYRLRYTRLSPPSPTGSRNEKELASQTSKFLNKTMPSWKDTYRRDRWGTEQPFRLLWQDRSKSGLCSSTWANVFGWNNNPAHSFENTELNSSMQSWCIVVRHLQNVPIFEHTQQTFALLLCSLE